MNKICKIAGLGEVLWDIYGTKKHPGGAPANFAAHTAQAGCEGYILSRVGKDKLGSDLVKKLSKLGLNVSGVQTDATHATGTVKVSLDDEGVPSFECSQDVAFDYLELDDNFNSLMGEMDAVLWGTLAQRNHESRHTIQQSLQSADDAVKVFDINLRGWDKHYEEMIEESLQLATIIKLNKDELKILKEKMNNTRNDIVFLRELMQKYEIDMSAVTFGEDGSLLVAEHEHDYHAGFKVDVVDTTGSGDAFAAGLLIKYIEGVDLPVISEFANRLGAFVATQQGAVPKWTEEDLMSIDIL